MTQICKLCKLEKQLRSSHILPEFMYQNLYDEKHRRFYKLKVDINDISKSSIKIEQKGIREFLLCDQCEGLISKYEKYASETIYAKNKGNKVQIINSIKINDGQFAFHECNGFLYKELMLRRHSLTFNIC